MKIGTFENKKYYIGDEFNTALNKTNSKPMILKFKPFPGEFIITDKSPLKNKTGITLYNPNFVSYLYYEEPDIIEENIVSVSAHIDNKPLTTKLNLWNKNTFLYENGFEINTDKIKIHPTYYLNWMVGVFFN